jgi:hypothetical protein
MTLRRRNLMGKLKIYDPRKDSKVKWKKVQIRRDGLKKEEIENFEVRVTGYWGGDRFRFDDEYVYFEIPTWRVKELKEMGEWFKKEGEFTWVKK